MTVMRDFSSQPAQRSYGTLGDRLSNVIVSLAFAGLLGFFYKVELSEYWRYMGFVWDLSVPKLGVSLLIIGTLAFVLPTQVRFRDIYLQLCLYFHFIPSVLIFSFQDLSLQYFLAVLTGTFLLIGFSFFPMRRLKAKSLTWLEVFWISLAICLVVLAAIIAFTGVTRFSLSFSDVYAFRAESNETLPGIFGYLRPATTKVVLPLVMILAFMFRSKALIILTALLCIGFYGYSYHKVILFASFTSVCLFVVMRRVTSAKYIGFLAVFLLFLVGLSMVYGHYLNEETSFNRLASIVVRRSIFVPVLLDNLHVDFFSRNPFYYWSQSSIGLGIADRPFELNAAFMIGLEFFGSEKMSANTGYIGSGFSNAGFFGIAIYGAIIGFVISFLDEYGKKVGHPILIALGFTLILGAMRGSDLPTIFMTHGLMLLILMVIFFPKKSELVALEKRGPQR